MHFLHHHTNAKRQAAQAARSLCKKIKNPAALTARIATIVAIAALALLGASCVNAGAKKDGGVYTLTVLHTNDHHGRFWQNEYGEYGLAAQKTLIDRIRAEVESSGGSVLLLSAGDVNMGVPESDLQDAEPDFRGMSLIGYDAMALGNHEFDKPLSVLRKQEGWATFPFLSANIYDKKTGQRLFKPYALFDRGGLKIAVFGLTTEDTPKIANPEYLTDIEFKNPVEEAKTLVRELRASEKPDVIFALTHMGHYDDAKYGSNAPGDVTLARALPKNKVAAIVGGHSQNALCMEGENLTAGQYEPGAACTPDKQNGIWILQAHEWGKYVGRADFEFKNGKMTLVNYELIPVNLKKTVEAEDGSKKRVPYTEEIPQDPAMLALLEPFYQKGQAELNKKIGSVSAKLDGDRSSVRFTQTNLGRLILSAYIARTGANFGVMNGGGIRDSIQAGDIAYKDVLKVQPFGNTVVYIDMSGADVVQYLTEVSKQSLGSGGYPQFANVGFTASKGTLENITIEGEPIDAAKTYRMATLSFAAVGGDGYPKISDKQGYVNTGFADAEVLMQYITDNSPVDASKYEPAGELSWK